MTLVLQPQNYFTIVHQISNHLDNNTYYVQAVIRNAFSDEIIATVQLTDKGGRRFKYDWRVPADAFGQGFYVSIVTSVYTDSLYTTKSENYGDDENTYLVQERVFLNGLGGSGGIDTFDLRRVLREELDKLKETPEENEDEPEIVESPEPMRWEEILSAILDLKNYLIEAESGEDDYSSILNQISFSEGKIIQQIKDSEADDPEDIDFSPLMNEVMGMQHVLEEKIDLKTEEVKKAVIDVDKDGISEKISRLMELLTDPEIQQMLNVKKPKEEPLPVKPINNLSL